MLDGAGVPDGMSPQTTTEPSAFTARLVVCPAAIATTPLFASSGTVTSPDWSKPQATTEPSDLSARLCPRPAAIATTPLRASSGTSDSPSTPPQATTEPSAFNARLCCPRAEIAITPLVASSGTSSCSLSFVPQAITRPFAFNASACSLAASIAITPLWAAAGMSSCWLKLRPQPLTDPRPTVNCRDDRADWDPLVMVSVTVYRPAVVNAWSNSAVRAVTSGICRFCLVTVHSHVSGSRVVPALKCTCSPITGFGRVMPSAVMAGGASGGSTVTVVSASARFPVPKVAVARTVKTPGLSQLCRTEEPDESVPSPNDQRTVALTAGWSTKVSSNSSPAAPRLPGLTRMDAVGT